MASVCNPSTLYSYCPSPLGDLLLVGDGERLSGLYFPGHLRGPARSTDWRLGEEAFASVRQQLAEYFAGGRLHFDLPLRLTGTPFQRRVWSLLQEIPFGGQTTYGELARRLEASVAVRAVGAAVGANPVSIVVPCHRVLGADGRLRGFAGGLERKAWLLKHEQRAGQPNGSRTAPSRLTSSAANV
jgi:methylated-DNA-[protein]-cysteine S-methyltransferase